MDTNTNRDKQWYKLLYLGVIVLLAIGIAWLWQKIFNPAIEPMSMTLPSVAMSEIVNEPIQPIPLVINLDEKKLILGKKLFHDPILSGNNQVSCASCHNLQLGGGDGLSKAIGINGKVGNTNTLTVFNSSFNPRLDWDGKFATLQAQVKHSIENPVTMGSSWPQALQKLASSPIYQDLFKQAYQADIDQENVADAIATYEMSLITPNSRFDQFLRGDQSALSVAEKQGYQAFKNYGCISCHQGVNVGGNIFQRFGVLGDYFADRGDIGKIDFGRFNVTNLPQDIYVFRVPSLRNVALTYPYFHDGSASTLETAIAIMAKYQLGREISAKDLKLIAKFLHTLTGEYEGKLTMKIFNQFEYFRKILIGILLILCLILFWFKSQLIDFNQHNIYVVEMRQINEIDATINQDILRVRYGLLTYYDPIVNNTKNINNLVDKLQKVPSFIAPQSQQKIQAMWSEYLQKFTHKQDLIEHFNAKNAITKNSLAYLPVIVQQTIDKLIKNSDQIIIDSVNNNMRPNDRVSLLYTDRLNQLLRDILIYNIAPTPQLTAQIKQHLIELNHQKFAQILPEAQNDLKVALIHAQIILENLPFVNKLIKEIVNLPTNQAANSIFSAYMYAYQKALSQANIYRFGLYLTSIIGVILIAFYIIQKLRKSAMIIKEAEAKYRSIFENSLEGIFQVSPDGKYLSANPSLAEIYGYDDPATLIANCCKNASQYVLSDRYTELMKLLEKNGAATKFESQIYRRDRSIIWITESMKIVRDEEGNILYYEGIAANITDRKKAEDALNIEREKSEKLLLNILPEPIAFKLKQEECGVIAEDFAEATILFADLVGFTSISTEMSPLDLVCLLNQIFSAFDQLAEKYNVEKIKTIGDAYMVAAGLPVPREDHAEAIAQMALEMQVVMKDISAQAISSAWLQTYRKKYPNHNDYLQIRIGINSGPVVAGVIGIKKFIYDLWGDTVNVASRMESSGLPGRIQVTEKTYQNLKDKFNLEKRGTIDVKGKGKMTTYWLLEKKSN